MCDPATAAVVIGVSAGVAGYGAYRESNAKKKAAKYNAAVARNNAIIADRMAEDRVAKGRQEERNFRRQLSTLKGKQRSIYAGSGVVVDQDTPLDVLSETAELGEIDALTIKNNAEREAYGFRVQGMNFRAQEGLYTATAKNTRPLFDAFSTTLTSASSSAAMFAGSPSPSSTPKATPTGGK